LPSKKPVNKAQSDGGRKGAEKRWAKVSPQQRSEIMRAAALAPRTPKPPAIKNIFGSGLARIRWDKLTPEQRKEELLIVRNKRRSPNSQD